MDRDKLLLMEDKNFIMSMLKKIFSRGHRDFKKELIKAIDVTAREFKAQGKEHEIVGIINKRAGIKINSINDLKKNLRLLEGEEASEEGDTMNEGVFGDWWKEATANAYGALAFYPMLTMFLEFDKVLKGSPDASMRITIIYLLIWVLVIAGKI